MKPEDRIAEATKQLGIASTDDELSDNQMQALQGIQRILLAMEQSIEQQREQEVMADGGTLCLVCPACDLAQLTPVGSNVRGDGSDHDYLCSECGHTTNTPRERESRSNSDGLSGAAKMLSETDPDELGQPMTERGAIDPLVCPRGHHSIEISARSFRCKTCARNNRETVKWDKSELVDLREREPPEDERQLRADGAGRVPPDWMIDGEYDEVETRLTAIEKNVEWLRENGIESDTARRRLALINGDVEALEHIASAAQSDTRYRLGGDDE